MILTGNKIKEEVAEKNIILEPFKMENITTNSYDLSLGNKLIKYTDKIIDPKKKTNYEIITIFEEGFVLEKNSFYLGSSVEILGSKKFVPLIHAKSGIARLGLFVHITADLIDIGSIGNITFQLYPTMPIKVFPNMKIGQVTFWNVDGEISLYEGKYQKSSGPQPSKTYLDFLNKESENK